MRVNHNISAVVANAQLLKTENSLAASMERLASGLKINHAKDDPAGMAISNKMQAQIDGLAKASENASNGISVLQIADTALGEITSMLQRMRELSVQAASDTNQLDDREAMQREIDSLIQEVDRISRDTEYNTKKLLDGASDTRVYADGISRMTVSDAVTVGVYDINVIQAAAPATALAQTQAGDIPAGTITINGMEVTIAAGEDATSVYEKLRTAAEKGNVNLVKIDPDVPQDTALYPDTAGYAPSATPFAFGDTLAFVSNQFGTASQVDIQCSNADLMTFLNIAQETDGQNMELELDYGSAFGSQATASVDGNKVRITDISGFEMNFVMDKWTTGEIAIDVTDIGTMTLQIGANEHQTMEVRIPEISSKTLYLDEVDVTKVNGGSEALITLDNAINIASSARSAIGAYQNRLEYAVESLDASNEDMTSAISRLGDVNMAEEMSEYTKYTVLQQAGTSVLAQANDIPQTVLQLLQ